MYRDASFLFHVLPEILMYGCDTAVFLSYLTHRVIADLQIEVDTFECGGQSTCPLGATLASMQTTQSTMNAALSAQMSMIQEMNDTLPTLATIEMVELADTAAREYALDLVVVRLIPLLVL